MLCLTSTGCLHSADIIRHFKDLKTQHFSGLISTLARQPEKQISTEIARRHLRASYHGVGSARYYFLPNYPPLFRFVYDKTSFMQK